MKKCELCDFPAKMFCESDQASLCWDCDERVHGANFLVAKHTRTLLCHVCQSPTPWIGSGPKLGPTISVCNVCVGSKSSCSSREQSNNGGEEEEEEEEEEEDDDIEEEEEDDSDDDEGGDHEDEDDEENQVVPWTSTTPPPPVSSSSTATTTTSTEEGTSASNITFSMKRESTNTKIGFQQDHRQGNYCSSDSQQQHKNKYR
ncbi:hypothetical protein Dsin_027717 [Dipteronia sinensis]|uniref:B box-type domain-containing protein n=1 Tax=Dipteronia sinensis TaxID=43782 RepID=A0AAE0DTU9_9ROSI|nr:hypothetical protein Dsin_027717 [Dipteronia sinensis]